MQNVLIIISLIFAEFLIICFAKSYVITRALENEGHDRFEIVNNNFVCQESSYLDCKSKNGRRKSNMTGCECSCDKEFTTFGLYNRTWTCQNNTKLRLQSGCHAFFEGEDPLSSVKVLTKSNRYKILFPSISCRIDYSKSRYQECNGTWNRLGTSGSASKVFILLPLRENLPGKPSNRFFMKVSDQVPSVFLGRMVSLHFTCRNTCLLFKMNGKLRCPVASAVLPTKHIIKLSTAMSLKTEHKINSSKVISTLPTTTQTKNSPTENSPAVVLGIATAFGIAFLAGGIVAMVMIIRKRHKKRIPKSPSQNELSAPHSCDIGESSPQRNPEGGLIYDYATRENIWAKPRVTNGGYEIPQDDKQMNNMVSNEFYKILEDNKHAKLVELNGGYEIPADNWKTMRRESDLDNEISVDNNCSKLRQTNGEYEILDGNRRPMHGEPNSDYEVLVDNDYSKLRETNGGYEISDDGRSQAHREPNSAYEIPIDNKRLKRRETNGGYEIPQDYKGAYVDMSRKAPGKNDYMANAGEKPCNNTLYDSDEYVSMI